MKKGPVKIVHLEDERLDRELVAAMLLAEGIEGRFAYAETAAEFEAQLRSAPPDLILSDVALPGYDGIHALEYARKICPTVPFIFFSGAFNEETAVESLKKGATDYVLKRRPERLPAAVRRALVESEAQRERLKTEGKVREQAALLNEARDAICVTDLDQKILFWNKSAERLYGWTAQEAQGQSANELLMQDHVALEAIKKLIQTGEWDGELQQTTHEGKKIIVESRWTLMRSPAGEPISILQIATDITEKKELETRLLRSQRMESIGALAGGIAHDLNNVLGPILMASEFLYLKCKDPDLTRVIDIIEESARHGASMVKQILTFARGTEGERGTVQIRHLIGEMARVAEHTFPKSIKIVTRFGADIWTLQGNPTQLHQVLLNLCVNARDAMPGGGTLSISVSNISLDASYAGMSPGAKSGPYVVVSVSDTGVGMPPEICARIFEPFFTTKAVEQGTGLGLSTVQDILKSHEGFLAVQSQVGVGTEFKVYLPAQPDMVVETVEGARLSLPVGQGELILVADDEAAIRNITTQTLEMFGYRVVMAGDGAEAVAAFAARPTEIQLVITDLSMPVVDGHAAIRAIQYLSPKVRVIATSGAESQSPTTDPVALNAQAFLAKPYSAEELLHTVFQVLHGEETAST